MKKIIHFLIGLPGAGKSYYLSAFLPDQVFDDISQTDKNLERLTHALKSPLFNNIYIADVNFAQLHTLEAAKKIITKKIDNVDFSYILFVCSKERALSNVEFRQDGRNVDASINRFEFDIINTQEYIKNNYSNVEWIVTPNMKTSHNYGK